MSLYAKKYKSRGRGSQEVKSGLRQCKRKRRIWKKGHGSNWGEESQEKRLREITQKLGLQRLDAAGGSYRDRNKGKETHP